MLPRLAPRRPDSHKGDYGRALLIGGSRGMAGGIALAAMACLRSGAGLVTAAVPLSIQPTVAGFDPAMMTLGLPEDTTGRMNLEQQPNARKDLLDKLAASTVAAIGPGLGLSFELELLVAEVYRKVTQPLVVDADGLNALAKRPQAIMLSAGPRVLTPHPGEFGRLATAAGIPGHDQLSQAVQFAGRFGCVLVLKGHRSLITDGERNEINETGNPGMATGGSGDVLTGIITALLAQGMTPFDAAHLGCHVHGLAGDLAAIELGQISLTAGDLVRYLPQAWNTVQNGN